MEKSHSSEKGKTGNAADGKPGTVDEDVMDRQSCVIMGTHRLRAAGHVVSVSQPRVPQSESSKNQLPAPVLK